MSPPRAAVPIDRSSRDGLPRLEALRRAQEARARELADPLQGEIAFRASMGLRSDRAYVEGLHARSDKAELSAENGLPLTAQETVDVRQRMRLQAQLIEGQVRISDILGASFAGVSIDQKNGGEIRILYSSQTPPTEDQVSQVAAVLPDARVLSFRPARFSEATLNAAYQQLLVRLNESGLHESAVALDAQRNRVLVAPGSGGLNATELRAVIDELPPELAETVEVPDLGEGEGEVVGITTGRSDEDPPMRGGMRIDVAGVNCSAGAPRIRQQQNPGNQNPVWRVLTAGHCLPRGGFSGAAYWFPPFSDIWGLPGAEVFREGTFADAGLVKYSVLAQDAIPGCNKVYKPTGDECMNSTVTSNPPQGTVLAGSNGYSGMMSGTVLNSQFTGTQCNANGTDCNQVVNQIKIEPLTQPGDSGSPWYNAAQSNKFVGIATAIYLYFDPQAGGIVPLGTTISTWPKIQAQVDLDGHYPISWP